MQAARAASIERFVDRVLLNAKTNLAAGQVPASSGKHVSRREPREAREPLPSIPEQPVQSRGDGVQEFVSRVLDHAAEHVRSSSSSCNGVLKELADGMHRMPPMKTSISIVYWRSTSNQIGDQCGLTGAWCPASTASIST
eukprot:g5386.t1